MSRFGGIRPTQLQSHLQGLVLETGHWRGLAYRSAGLQSHLQGLVLETSKGTPCTQAHGLRCEAISKAWCWRRTFLGTQFLPLRSHLQGLVLETLIRRATEVVAKPSPRLRIGDYEDRECDPRHLRGRCKAISRVLCWRQLSGCANRNLVEALQSHLQGLVLETGCSALQNHLQDLVLETNARTAQWLQTSGCKAISKAGCWRPALPLRCAPQDQGLRSHLQGLVLETLPDRTRLAAKQNHLQGLVLETLESTSSGSHPWAVTKPSPGFGAGDLRNQVLPTPISEEPRCKAISRVWCWRLPYYGVGTSQRGVVKPSPRLDVGDRVS